MLSPDDDGKSITIVSAASALLCQAFVRWEEASVD
jgi:hypothetical protein